MGSWKFEDSGLKSTEGDGDVATPEAASGEEAEAEEAGGVGGVRPDADGGVRRGGADIWFERFPHRTER